MKRSILLIVSLGLSCWLLATDIMKLSEIRTGMGGGGKNIF